VSHASVGRATGDRNPPRVKEDIIMAIEGIILPGTIPAAGDARRVGLLARWLLVRCGDWLRRRCDAARLRGMEPRLARDIGVAPGCDRGPEGFAVDPRPLWGIGLTPQPTEVPPAWFRRRRA
jgi:hypothetical protein